MAIGWEGTLTIGSSEVQYTRDVNMTLEASEVDCTTRADDGWENTEAGLAKWGAEFDMKVVANDTVYETILAAFLAKSILANVTITDGEGFAVNGNMSVTRCSKSEPLNGTVIASIKMNGAGKPTLTNP